ncbi:MAG: chemotaxis protein CheV [Phycisphaerales bacterium]|nr:chemotaxis protein CheV [Phycisphaerales bacterium]
MAESRTNILVESGTNELEVFVFLLNGGRFGVNVAKVREILGPVPLTRLPQSHPAVRGVFRLRDGVFPLVDLRRFFAMPALEDEREVRTIVMEFNDRRLGFQVDGVERIHRISWSQMGEVPLAGEQQDAAIIGVSHIAEKLVLMVDFERIAFRIAGQDALESLDEETGAIDRSAYTVVLAEDSPTIRKLLLSSLDTARFGRVMVFNDGQAALDAVLEMHAAGERPDVIVTDIEMPRMDGLHLTKRIKSHPGLKDVPVIVFSSLVSLDNLKKCEAVGADRQLTKPQLINLVKTIDELLAVPAAC